MRRRYMSMSKVPFDCSNYLTVEALEDGLIVTSCNTFEYGIDGQGWTKIRAGENTPSINAGQTISFRGDVIPIINYGVGIFNISKKCNLKGNCMSLLFGDDAANNSSLSGKNYAFYRLFEGCTNIVNVSSNFLPATTLADRCYAIMFWGCTSLITAPDLPATTLVDYCYYDMFVDCTSLTTAPELPATTLAYNCYNSMFRDCTSLTTAPELPATTLASECYEYMFVDCTSLTTAPELPATNLADYCYDGMFSGCTSLTTAPTVLPATTLERYCYNAMFRDCTSLTTAPELPATTLANNCYAYMFYGCINLNYIKMLATNISATNCLDKWVSSVASRGTFVKNPTMTTLPTGSDGIPIRWTVVDDEEQSSGENMIQFSIQDIDGQVYTFNAENGMSWEQWVNTDYNTHGVFIATSSYNAMCPWLVDGYAITDPQVTSSRPGASFELYNNLIKADYSYSVKRDIGLPS